MFTPHCSPLRLQTIDKLVLVMDACPHGDLSKFGAPSNSMPEEKIRHLDSEQIRFVALEVAAILLYLHDQLVIYRDMKPENLLLDAAVSVAEGFGSLLSSRAFPPPRCHAATHRRAHTQFAPPARSWTG